MKVTTRKVTVIQPVYIAEDGREFTDEDDCLYHEIGLKKKLFVFYNHALNKCDFDSCMFVKIPTQKHLDDFRDICKYEGVTVEGLNDLGIYVYLENRRERWFNLSPLVEEMMKEE